MIGGSYFHPIRTAHDARATRSGSEFASFVSAFKMRVIAHFDRACDTGVVVVPAPPACAADEVEMPVACHPACARFAASAYCRESWKLHMAEMRRQPQAHWHKCDQGMICGLVPISCKGRCVAFARIARSATAATDEFERQVDLLDLLVQGFERSEPDLLERLLRATERYIDHAERESIASQECGSKDGDASIVRRAVVYIERNLGDPTLGVASVAAALGVHPNYLSHLFVGQLGQRMSRNVAQQRIDRAKTLLTQTTWQIKRVAIETGYAHPRWFCHVFTCHTGVTPSEYRKRANCENPLNVSTLTAIQQSR